MTKYIKINKDTGTFLNGGSPQDIPATDEEFVSISIAWIQVGTNDNGQYTGIPALNGKSDKILFKYKASLTQEQLNTKNLTLVDIDDGTWGHLRSEEFIAAAEVAALPAKVDLETYSLIKAWCKSQDEGCEEAFINIGIADKTNVRYVAYT